MTARSLGVLFLVLGTAIAAAVLLAARDRVATRPVQAALAGAGVAVASGGLLVHGDAGAGDWVLAVAVLGLAFPVHFRRVLRGDA